MRYRVDRFTRRDDDTMLWDDCPHDHRSQKEAQKCAGKWARALLRSSDLVELKFEIIEEG